MDAVNVTIRNMIKSSCQRDKKRGYYDQANFIDYEHVYNLIQESNNQCYYCNCDLQCVKYTSNMGTIERLDNNIGHIKGNCAIACKSCNNKKVGQKRKRE